MTDEAIAKSHTWRDVWQVFWVFFRIGASAFGGPAATQGLVYSKIVAALKWIPEKDFLDLMGVVNVLPGPNAVEMAMHIGRLRAGRLGFFLGGLAFMLPGTVISAVFAAVYVRYSDTPSMEAVLYGVQPVVIGITAWSTFRLAKSARPSVFRLAVAVVVCVLYLLVSLNEVLLLAGAGLLMFAQSKASSHRTTAAAPLGLLDMGSNKLMVLQAGSPDADLGRVFLVFLKAGVLLFGGGTLLLAVLRTELVVNLGWLTETQLLEALSIGQITPGPILTTVTFIGYLLAGVTGAIVATVAVLAPSFVLMSAAGPLLRWVKKSPGLSAVLDGITLASIGILAAVTIQLGGAALVDWLTVLLALVAFAVLLLRPKFVLPLVAGGAVIGALVRLI